MYEDDFNPESTDEEPSQEDSSTDEESSRDDNDPPSDEEEPDSDWDDSDEESEEDDDSDWSSSDEEDDGSNDEPDVDTDDGLGDDPDEDSDDGHDGGSSHTEADEPDEGGGSASPRAPFPGEIVITELLINPVATDDAHGEWVELRNVSSSWINMAGAVLADLGVDAVEIDGVSSGSTMVAPGGIFTICAEADYWENGGVECDATFRYRTLGGGFALSNVEDEVILMSATGDLLDEVRYSDGFSIEGEAMGLRNDRTSISANDVSANWCEQISFLPFGDGGTPGESNDSCW